VESLLRQGQWIVLEHVLCLLFETEAVRPDLGDEQKQKLRALFDRLGTAERIVLIEKYLTKTEKPNTDGLGTVLLMMPPGSVPAICALLGNLENPSHQTIVSDALSVLAKDQADPVLRSLADRRPAFVRQLLAIIGKWRNPKHAEVIEKLVRYPDAGVRREVIRTLGLLRPSGNGARFVALLSDADEGVRLASLKLLVSGSYTAPFSAWEPVVTADDFGDRSHTEKRNIFHAMRATSLNEAVPYWCDLLTDWGWTNRKKREDLALLAAETLGKLATAEAIAALEIGQQKGGASIKQACAVALAAATRQKQKAS
jgi:HEAT repeat protein